MGNDGISALLKGRIIGLVGYYGLIIKSAIFSVESIMLIGSIPVSDVISNVG